MATDLKHSDSVHSSLSEPSVQLVRVKPSLFKRVGARVKGRRPALRLGAPKSPSVRI